MAPFRNFLARKPAPSSGAQANTGNENGRHSMDSRRPSPLSIRTSRAEGPDEYKMSGMLLNFSMLCDLHAGEMAGLSVDNAANGPVFRSGQ